MFDTFILLTGPVEAAALSTVVRLRNPSLTICHVASLDELNALGAVLLARSRLVAFATAVIVPLRVLNALGYGAYNFHPGSPQFPGWAAGSFAVYERARSFGATAHVMVEKVDAGPIVGVETFIVPEGTPLPHINELALIMLARLFWNLSDRLASQEAPLDLLPISWSGRKGTRRHYREMCDVPKDVSKKDLDRRVEAFGGGDYGCPLTVTLHGHTFHYVGPETEPAATAPEMPETECIAKRA